MSSYQGMRWLKCDLQVQTPEDSRHWDPADPLRLTGSPPQREEQDLQDKARRYLRRCHDIGLDVIGVTDHNFCGHKESRKRFLTHLIEQNLAVAAEVGRDPLWIFPGFEVNIGYHVLCLFPPEVSKASRLDEVCDVLTQLGLPSSNRFTSNGPAPLRRDDSSVPLSVLLRSVQEEHHGIVIAAHAFQDSGIASEGRWAPDYRNEDLLCVEVSSFPLGARENAILEHPQDSWRRSRPPAYIMSSDAKSTLTDDSGQPKPNSLGYRWTWIKMSEPSIEALRQAFLDWPSRIRLEGDPRIVKHDRIHSLSVQGAAFLADQEIVLSPHLTCLIGGRGSGKSSLIEYARIALRRDSEGAAREQVTRIQKTLDEDSLLRLVWLEADDAQGTSGPEDVFEYRPSVGPSRVLRDATDPATIFQKLGVQIFSQGELTSIARNPNFLLRFLDSLIGESLTKLRQEEAQIREQIRLLRNREETVERLRTEERALEQQAQELGRRWSAHSAVQEEQTRHRAAQEAQRYLETVAESAFRIGKQLEEWGLDLTESHAPLGSVVRNWPESAYFEDLDIRIEEEKHRLSEEIRQAAHRYQARVRALTEDSPMWEVANTAIQKAEQDLRDACARQGLLPEDLDQLFQLDQQRKAKSLELESTRRQRVEIEEAVQKLGKGISTLQEVWRNQTRTREEEIQKILNTDAIPQVPRWVAGRTEGRRPTIEIRIGYQANSEDFLKHWRELAPDARTRLGRQWDELGDHIFSQFLSSDVGSPWQLVQDQTRENAELLEHLNRRRDLWNAKQTTRIQDEIDLVLYRNDGTEAGSLRRRQLSDGQTNTAILMLLLASGEAPILIDQPEDELDSSFIFQQLVPLLREIKTQRQVVIATHNPNLPVNADAELIYALQAKAVEGKARGVVLAQGGLDREAVKDAVLEIMEGSEEAFRKRREKYHF